MHMDGMELSHTYSEGTLYGVSDQTFENDTTGYVVMDIFAWNLVSNMSITVL